MIVHTLSEYIFILLYFTSYSDRVYFYINILYTDSAENYYPSRLISLSISSSPPLHLLNHSIFAIHLLFSSSAHYNQLKHYKLLVYIIYIIIIPVLPPGIELQKPFQKSCVLPLS